MTGHGRTCVEGEPLALINDWRHPIDDGVGFIRSLFEPNVSYGPKRTDIPFFISGISTGGTIAINVALEIDGLQRTKASEEHQWSAFRGAILFCPLLARAVEIGEVKYQALRALKSIGFKSAGLGPKPEVAHFPSKDAYNRLASDPLCYYDGILLSTGTVVLKIIEVTKEFMEHIKFPFVLLHGRNDPVTLLSGSEELLNRSSTPKHLKELASFPDATHYMMVDGPEALDTYVKRILGWAHVHLVPVLPSTEPPPMTKRLSAKRLSAKKTLMKSMTACLLSAQTLASETPRSLERALVTLVEQAPQDMPSTA